LADRESRRRSNRSDDVGVVLLVGREDREDDLDVVLVALWKERPDRPVGQPSREDRSLGRARLALNEAAGDLACGVHPLLEVDGERKEVEAWPRIGAIRGSENDCVAVADGAGTAGESGELAGLEGQRRASKL